MPVRVAIIENHAVGPLTIRSALYRALKADGMELTILTTGDAAELENLRTAGYRVIDTGWGLQDPRVIARHLWKLRQGLKACAPDVCLTFTIRPALWGNAVTRSLNIPTITNITGIGPLFDRNNLAYITARMLYQIALKKTARVVFQNQDDRTLFLSKGYVEAAQTILVPGSGVDFRHFAPLPKAPNAKFRFVFISRLVKDKGVVEYVTAAKMLKAAGVDATFCVVGPLWTQNLGSNTVSEQELQQWQDAGFIEYGGVASDVRPVIAAADCVVLPSYREGTSNVLLEASSMERPCVTTNTTGCKEIVEDNVTGFLCQVANASDLASKMRKMMELTGSQREAMGKAARAKVIREFDKQIVIDTYLRTIKEITQ
jgi:glycosyltransferase involved in cell wall biosynthesis